MKKLIQISAIDLTLYKFALPLMNALREDGWEVAAAAADTGYMSKIKEEGFGVHIIPIPRNLSPVQNLKALRELIQFLRREKPDCIHVHTPIAALLGRVAARLTGVPTVFYTLHGLYPRFPFLQVEKLLCRAFTDQIFTVNAEDRTYLLGHHYQSHQRICNINSVGVDTTVFDPARFSQMDRQRVRQELGVGEEPVIGFVGRLVREKGIRELIEAFISLRVQTPCKLLLIGSAAFGERDQTTYQWIQERLSQAEVAADVLQTGHREDIPELMTAMDLFVLPSYREGMPVSTLEAMAMELPVVATDIRGCREEITPDTGLLVPVQDIGALQQAIRFFLDHPEELRSKGRAGRERVCTEFSVERVIEKQMEYYRQLQ